MASAATVKSSSSTVETSTEARLPPSREPPGHASMIKSAERAGMISRLAMRRTEAMLGACETPAARGIAMKPVSPAKSSRVVEVVAINEDSAVRYVSVMVVNNVVVMPVRPPMVPSPAKPAEVADSKTEAKPNSRASKIQPWVRIPTRPDPDRSSIRKPGVVLRHVHHLRVRRFDHNGFSVIAHLFL